MTKNCMFGSKCEEVETLFDGKRDNSPYRSSTFVVSSITVQATIVTTFPVDGILATIPFGHQV
jgi:hypothetical protein